MLCSSVIYFYVNVPNIPLWPSPSLLTTESSHCACNQVRTPAQYYSRKHTYSTYEQRTESHILTTPRQGIVWADAEIDYASAARTWHLRDGVLIERQAKNTELVGATEDCVSRLRTVLKRLSHS